MNRKLKDLLYHAIFDIVSRLHGVEPIISREVQAKLSGLGSFQSATLPKIHSWLSLLLLEGLINGKPVGCGASDMDLLEKTKECVTYCLSVGIIFLFIVIGDENRINNEMKKMPKMKKGFAKRFDVIAHCKDCGESRWHQKDENLGGPDRTQYTCTKCGEFFVIFPCGD